MVEARRPILIVILIVLVGGAFFTPFLGRVHLFDWDEANFAEASREMIERGDYLQVTIDYHPFYEKPPLFMWLQVVSMKMFGVNEFGARFVNAACGMVTLGVVFLLGRRVYGTAFGLFWALAFFGSILPHFLFKTGVIDPVFNLFIFLGLTAMTLPFLCAGSRSRTKWFAIAGISIGLAVLAKGPVALLIACLTMSVYWAVLRFRRLCTLIDVLVFVGTVSAVACVFFGVETLVHGTVFLKEFIAYQVRLFSTGDSGHGRPFYFHFFVILFGCFPASIFAVAALLRRDDETPGQRDFNRLMIVLLGVVLILFSVVETKTVLYSSLAYFPVTYLAALCLHRLSAGRRAVGKPLLGSLAGVGILVSGAMIALPVLFANKAALAPFITDAMAAACLQSPVEWSGYEFLVGCAYAAAVAISLVFFARQRPGLAAATLFGSTALCLFAFLPMIGPKIEAYTQGGPIDFYQSHAAGNAYVRAGFKSYADLFYSKKRPGEDPRSHDKDWLLRGQIDKPAYLVVRVTQAGPYEDATTSDLVRLKSEFGFVYYWRDVPLSR